LALAVVTAIVAIEWSRAGIVFGLLGALTGMFVTLTALKAGILAGALALGVRVHTVVVGIGPRITEWRFRHSVVVIRAVPLLTSVEVGPNRLPVRPRFLGTALISALFGAAAVVLFAVTASEAFGLGLALGAAGALIKSLLPTKADGSTSTGWLLFRKPDPERAAQLKAAPGVLDVFDLVQAGELDAAERLVGRLTAEHPRLRTVRASRVLVLEARGRYSEALTLAIGMMSSDEEQQPHDAAAAMAAVAGLTGAAVEAGQLEASAGLPVAARALNEAVELGKPSYMMDGVRALLALLAGDPQLAVRLARLACENNDGSLGRADDLATLARAYMAAGDNSAARRTLAKAERLMPWWPRVALTRRRLDLA
jgi:hypothetical protein